MKNYLIILFFMLFFVPSRSDAQMVVNALPNKMQRCEVVDGDTVITVYLRNIYCYPRQVFKSAAQERLFWKNVRAIKKTLPLAKLIHGIMLETYEYIETLPTEKAKQAHLKKMQSELFHTYKPTLKKLTYYQGKILIKLIYRECRTSSYGLIQAYLGNFAAGFWNGFGKLFGVSLKAEWDPQGKDRELEKICVMVEYGAI